MDYRILGRTGLEVSVLGMGTGGLDPLGIKSGRSEAEMRHLLKHAFDLGINLFDTSPIYGAGRSERILGEVLRDLPRQEVVVSTKISLAASMPGKPIQIMAPQQIRECVEASLVRLQLETVELLLMAVAGPEHLDSVLNDQLPELQLLQREGKIRFIGTSELTRLDGSHEWLQAALPSGAVDVVLVGHNMINQSARRLVFPVCSRRNIGVMNVFTVRNLFWNLPRLKEVIADLKQRGLLADDDVSNDDPLCWILEGGECETLVEAAYRYAAYTPGVTSVICGTVDRAKLTEDIAFIAKGPLPTVTTERLHRTFGHLEEAIGN